MMARGFKPVGWVAAVAGAALCCYMLSLNVAAERAELAKIERQIIVAKQDIRALQTELGTRGRMEQLEHWNAEVLALSAPNAAQFLESEVVLARFETKQPTIEDRAKVQMAAANNAPRSVPAPILAPADYAAAAAVAAKDPKPVIHRASFAAPLKPPPVQKAAALPKPAELKLAAAPRLFEKKPRVEASKKAKVVLAAAVAKPESTLAEANKPAKTKPAKKAVAASTGILDDSLLRELGEASRSEKAEAGAR